MTVIELRKILEQFDDNQEILLFVESEPGHGVLDDLICVTENGNCLQFNGVINWPEEV